MEANNTTDARQVAIMKPKEQESIKAKVKVDIAVVLPEDIGKDDIIELKYDSITKAVNEYVERYTIDPRISEVEYILTTPKFSNDKTTNDLKEVLTEKPMANISDHVSMYNIAPFGKCHTVAYPPTGSATAANHGHLTPMPCVPGTVSEWINGG